MYDSSWLMRIFDKTVEAARGIAEDHEGRDFAAWWTFEEGILPPSIASGRGQLTHALFFQVIGMFETGLPPDRVSRTRDLTWYRPGTDKFDGVNVQFTAERELLTTVAGLSSTAQVGNAMSEAWGVFAGRRERKLVQVLQEMHQLLAQPFPFPIEHACKWDDLFSV